MSGFSVEYRASRQVIPDSSVSEYRYHVAQITKLGLDHLVTPSEELIAQGNVFREFVRHSLVDTFVMLVGQEVPGLELNVLDLLAAEAIEDKLEPIFGKRSVRDPVKLESIFMYVGFEMSRKARWRGEETFLCLAENHVQNRARIKVLENFVPGYALSKNGLRTRGGIKSLKHIVRYEETGELLTHATWYDLDSIFASGIVSRFGVIGPVCMSRDCVSLAESGGVFVFMPEVLRAAGYQLWCVRENKDADIIREVRTSLPIPLFLASGFFPDEVFPYDDLSKYGSGYTDQMHDSCARGERVLQQLKSGRVRA